MIHTDGTPTIASAGGSLRQRPHAESQGPTFADLARTVEVLPNVEALLRFADAAERSGDCQTAALIREACGR